MKYTPTARVIVPRHMDVRLGPTSAIGTVTSMSSTNHAKSHNSTPLSIRDMCSSVDTADGYDCSGCIVIRSTSSNVHAVVTTHTARWLIGAIRVTVTTSAASTRHSQATRRMMEVSMETCALMGEYVPPLKL